MSHSPTACPYVGLQPYTEADRAFFFGREGDQETIAANLLTARLTLLYGASGVGKSSVLSAGVVPYLRTMNDVVVVTFRDWQDRTFLSKLKGAILTEVQRVTGRAAAVSDSLPLDEFIIQALQSTRRTLALILDQFEEYFLYHPEADNPFEVEFARVVNRPEVNARFLLALREDGLAQLDRFQGRIPNLMSNYLRLEHLSREGALSAIRKPLDVYNAQNPGQPPMTIEPELVQALIEQTRTGSVSLGSSGRGALEGEVVSPEQERVEAPFLQMVLTRLWEEEKRVNSNVLQLQTLTRLGGAGRIVRTHLDAVMAQLTGAQRVISARLFDRLVTPSGTKIAQASDDLVAYAARPEREVKPLLQALAAKRILRPIDPPVDRPTATRYEIFHDVLASAILDWRDRYLRGLRRRRIQFAGIALGLLLAVIIGGLWINLQITNARLVSSAKTNQDLSQAILSQPTTDATLPPTAAAARETAAAGATSAAQVLCQGAPNIRFTASKTTIVEGENATLTWDQDANVIGVSLDAAQGAVPLNGNQVVKPLKTTTYTLTATGCGGAVNKQITIQVNPAAISPTPEPPTASPTAPSLTPAPSATRTLAPTATPLPVVIASPTLAAPPAVYVTKLRTEPLQLRTSPPPQFYATFLNTTGVPVGATLCVEIWQPDDTRKAFGISDCAGRTIPTGTSEQGPFTWTVGRLGACAPYRGRVVRQDEEKARTGFVQPAGAEAWLDFNVCP